MKVLARVKTYAPYCVSLSVLLARSELQALIRNVTQNLVNIKDESGQFLLRLDDGRVIDTKGWAGWEWTHGVGLYGIYQYYQQTGDIEMRDIIDRWFDERFCRGSDDQKRQHHGAVSDAGVSF